MDTNLIQIKKEVYDKCSFEMLEFTAESESREYGACQFVLSERIIISRNAKITPKKVGQFVTFWKRKQNGPIEPFDVSDQIDFLVVNVRIENEFAQFVFPKAILIKHGIISTEEKEGKRAFRVYPKWDIPQNRQAIRTQKWQLDYFYKINNSMNLEKVSALYGLS